ncbi:hypothetical protein BDN71DRAFT_1436363 [Pleurotus eryngii]|uniref:Uncharacterized protein n=1 Tax=Pleurotus eryngii TaxID=5323 RepID=A0A9P5ZK66_PLEER|nr:hypothetical protein BDN71DRAFT_1436363 [Pleurotus eryngii]
MQDHSPPSATGLGSAAPAFMDLSVHLSLDATLPTTKREEYPNVKFWTCLQWTKVNTKFKSETKVTNPTGSDAKPKKKSSYIETADSELLSEDQMSKIWLTMCSSFQHLKWLNLLPDTWTKICHVGRKLYLLMAEQIAIDNFPSWYNNHVRIKKKPVKKQESVDTKPPSLKRSKSPPVVNLSAKKAQMEVDINNESYNNNMDVIYYEPEPTAEGDIQLNADPGKAVTIYLVSNTTNPLDATGFCCRQPCCHYESQRGFGCTMSINKHESSAVVSPVNKSSAVALPVSTYKQVPHTPVVKPTPLPQSSSQPVPQQLPPATRAWKAHRATVGKANNPKNHCKAMWIKDHPEGDKDEFKMYWNEMKDSFNR